jgi:hypothetical protein
MTVHMEKTTSAPEKTTSPITVSSYWPTAIILIILGWGGLFAIIQFTTPNGGTRWLFFLTLIMAITGLALPLVAFANKRFPSKPPVSSSIVIRQALWFGVYAATLAWLQIGRVLNPAIALLLFVGLIIIEWLLRLRERSQWKP